MVLSDLGWEPSRPIVGVIGIRPDPMLIERIPVREIDGRRGIAFGWFGKARPNFFVEPFFSSVAVRGDAVYIWHDLRIAVVCGPQGHRLTINVRK